MKHTKVFELTQAELHEAVAMYVSCKGHYVDATKPVKITKFMNGSKQQQLLYTSVIVEAN